MLTLHGAKQSVDAAGRQVVATRWLGEDATFSTRPWVTSPPFTGGLKPGECFHTSDTFPIVWRAKCRNHLQSKVNHNRMWKWNPIWIKKWKLMGKVFYSVSRLCLLCFWFFIVWTSSFLYGFPCNIFIRWIIIIIIIITVTTFGTTMIALFHRMSHCLMKSNSFSV